MEHFDFSVAIVFPLGSDEGCMGYDSEIVLRFWDAVAQSGLESQSQYRCYYPKPSEGHVGMNFSASRHPPNGASCSLLVIHHVVLPKQIQFRSDVEFFLV
jgi:hypothetical protein